MEKAVSNAMESIHKHPNIKQFLLSHEGSFMWCTGPEIDTLVRLTDEDGHSGASFACCMQLCKAILINESKQPQP